jgi:site-specific DNA recombinase
LARYTSRIELHSDRVILQVLPVALIDNNVFAPKGTAQLVEDIRLTVLGTLGRIGKEVRLVIDPSTSMPASRGLNDRDPALIKLIVKAHAALTAVMAAPKESIGDIAEAQGRDGDYFGVLLRLSWLAPDITHTILDGHQPAGINRQSLARLPAIPLQWDQQKSAWAS